MFTNNDDFTPYFEDELLYLPETAIALLIRAGLETEVAESARHGLIFDNRERKNEIAHAVEQTLIQIFHKLQASAT